MLRAQRPTRKRYSRHASEKRAQHRKRSDPALVLRDPHRLDVTGPTRWSAADVICPPALRPAVVLLLAMLASKGTSVLRNIAVIERGYEGLWSRLNELGAAITPFRD